MSKDDPQDDHPPTNAAWFGRRKRIVSRDISSIAAEAREEVAEEMHAAARGTLRAADVIDIPSLPAGPPPEAILDPTLFSERHRRRGQNRSYRFTQFIIVVALLCASGAIAFSFFGHRLRAMSLAGGGCLLAAISVRLVRRSSLTRRLRGYAAAACVLGLIALAASCVPNLFRDDVRAPAEKKPADVTPF